MKQRPSSRVAAEDSGEACPLGSRRFAAGCPLRVPWPAILLFGAAGARPKKGGVARTPGAAMAASVAARAAVRRRPENEVDVHAD